MRWMPSTPPKYLSPNAIVSTPAKPTAERQKYVLTYRVECVRGGVMKERDLTFKVWADSGKDAIKHLYHERGIARGLVDKVEVMQDGQRVRVG